MMKKTGIICVMTLKQYKKYRGKGRGSTPTLIRKWPKKSGVTYKKNLTIMDNNYYLFPILYITVSQSYPAPVGP
jgi:hypothetical protein